MTTRLASYVSGDWRHGVGAHRQLVNPVSGEKIAEADSTGIDMSAALEYSRSRGGGELRQMSFSQRGALLKSISDVLIANREKYAEIALQNCGNTKLDLSIDIDGGIGVLKYYSKIASSLGDSQLLREADEQQLAKDPVFFCRHYWTARPGAAIQINAFNFPSWGMWEKIAAATVAGVPSVAKPATATALMSFEMMKDVIESGTAPDGVLSIVCGSGEGLLESVAEMDSIAFTGSAATALQIRQNKNVIAAGARLNVEADSINGAVIGPDVTPGSILFEIAVKEVVKALSVKAGQLCTNIRRVFVPETIVDAFIEAVETSARRLTMGDPADEEVRVGPVVNKRQQEDAFAGIKKLASEARVVFGGSDGSERIKDISANGAFVEPTLLFCSTPAEGKVVHDVEVFGPCATIMPYHSFDRAIAMAARGGGSLALSLFTNDQSIQERAVMELGPWHGRLMLVDEMVGKNHTSHAIVMPQCVHGGPGRAGGGEELGGLRGLRLHMQRSSIQASPDFFSSIESGASTSSL